MEGDSKPEKELKIPKKIKKRQEQEQNIDDITHQERLLLDRLLKRK